VIHCAALSGIMVIALTRIITDSKHFTTNMRFSVMMFWRSRNEHRHEVHHEFSKMHHQLTDWFVNEHMVSMEKKDFSTARCHRGCGDLIDVVLPSQSTPETLKIPSRLAEAKHMTHGRV